MKRTTLLNTRVLFPVFICIIFVLAAGCEKSPSPLDSKEDWSDIYLMATGYGTLKGQERLSALQEAKQDAYSRLEAQVLKLKIDSKRDVGALIIKNEKLKGKLEIYIHSAKVVATKFLPESDQMSVSMELYLGTDFKTALGLKEKKPEQESKPLNTAPPSGSGGMLR